MRVLSSALLALGLLGLSTAASAEFTVSEQGELLRLLDAQRSIQQAIFVQAVAVRDHWSVATAQALVTGLRNTFSASDELRLARSLLLGVQAIDGDPSPHEVRLSYIFWHLGRAVIFIDAADAALRSTGLAARHHLQAARADTLAFDRGLTYAAPRPASYPNVVGPHGVYDNAQRKLSDMEGYLTEAIVYALDVMAVDSGALSAYASDVYKLLDSAGATLTRVAEVRFRITFPVSAEDASQSVFFRVLNALKTLSVPVPSGLDEIQIGLAALATVRSGIQPALGRLTDSWKNLDHGIWELLDFPNCTPAQQAQGCGGM